MNLEELTERTKETIILHGPEAWKQQDYLQNARKAGLSLDEAVALAHSLVDEIKKHDDRLKRFQTSITEEYERRSTNGRNAPLNERLLQSWLADLHPLHLSENFVRKHWIPALIAQLPPITNVLPPITIPAPVASPIPRGVYGALFILFLLVIVYWPRKQTTSESEPVKVDPTIENSDDGSDKKADPKTPTKPVDNSRVLKPMNKKTLPLARVSKVIAKPKVIVKKEINSKLGPKLPYDKIEEQRGQFGERQAQKKGKWGLWSDHKNDWLVYPNYEDITVFGNGRATVHSNGKDYDIDQYGKSIRD